MSVTDEASERRQEIDRGRERERKRERLRIMRFPPSARRQFWQREDEGMRERAERERRTKEKKGQPLVKREKVKHHGDKRHRRGILSVAGLLLTGIRARGGIRKTGRQESPTIPVKTENIFLSIREGTGGGGGIVVRVYLDVLANPGFERSPHLGGRYSHL